MKTLPMVAIIIFLIVGILATIGWIMNIISICHMTIDHVTGELIVRIIGIFFGPIGAIAGWF